MTKIVINNCYGGFSLSEEAVALLHDIAGLPQSSLCMHSLDRDNPYLVQVIEHLGSARASDRYARLTVVDVPAGTQYRIREFDGQEWIEYRDSTDWLTA